MKLKQRERSNFPSYLKKILYFIYKAIFNRKTKILFNVFLIIALLLGGFVAGLVFVRFFGTFDNPSQRAIDFLHFMGIMGLKGYKRQIEAIMAENIKIPFNYLAGQFSKPERIYIDIAFDNYQKIAYKREQALNLRVLFSSGEDYVPAKIRYKGEEVNVRLRLKGDSEDHWGGDKWSFRIKVGGGNKLFGMETFSIQQPKTREYLGGYLYYRALEKMDLISLRYNFVEVIINGENKGIYAVEEHFGKELLENNNRREGVIIKFNEDEKWREILRLIEQFPNEMDVLAHIESEEGDSKWFYSSNIESFDDEKLLVDPVLSKQFIEARDLLESFRKGDLKTHEVFDLDKTAKYYALNTLLGCAHGSFWSNIRFYYNPINSKLEPIGYDSSCGSETSTVLEKYYLPDCLSYSEECYGEMNLFNDLVFRDEVFFEKYMQELEKISNEEFLNKLFEDLDDEIKKYKRIIHKDEPFYHFSTKVFYRNLKQAENFLNPVKSMNIYFEETTHENKIILSIGNIGSVPLEIVNVVYNDSVVFVNSGDKIVQPIDFPRGITYEMFEFEIPTDFVWEDEMTTNLKLNYKLLGLENIKNESIFPYSYVEEEFLETDFIRQDSNIESFDFLEIGTNSITIKKGFWELNESLIIPKGFHVVCEAGTTLDLLDGSMILSYSPLQFSGTENNIIKIISSDKTGQGLSVLDTNQISRLEYVEFIDLTNPSKENWELTGAVNFYESPVEFDNVKFIRIASEDSLNLINSDFEIKNSLFENCFSDCFDNDFGNGLIESLTFNNCGNDCLDFSKSNSEIKGLIVTNMGDKGISIGEESNVSLENIKISGGELGKGYIGIASKDKSIVVIKNIELSNLQYGLAVYEKKSEFGPASLEAFEVKFYNVENNHIVEKNSNLLIDGLIVLGNKEGVYEELYGEEV